jgi:hypothetical protein
MIKFLLFFEEKLHLNLAARIQMLLFSAADHGPIDETTPPKAAGLEGVDLAMDHV